MALGCYSDSVTAEGYFFARGTSVFISPFFRNSRDAAPSACRNSQTVHSSAINRFYFLSKTGITITGSKIGR